MENLVEVRGLCKQYPGFSLEQVDLTVPAGQIVGLIGENGAGKTTVIRAISGALRPDRGTVRLLGGDPADPVSRREAAAAFEDAYFYGGLKTGQIERTMAGVCPGWDGKLFQEYCARFGLDGGKPVKDFSRGMRMKLSLATALARRPRLLVLDEPTGGLDPVVRGEVLDLFLDFLQDERRGILFSTHITGDLERIADQIAYLHGGRLLFQMDKDELLEGRAVLRCSEAELNQLPSELVLARRRGHMGTAALVREPAKVRRLLPGAVVDRLTLDELMQFYTGRDAS